MSFNVSLLIRAESSQARAEIAGLAAALPRLGQGGAQAAQGARTLSEATARLERSTRSTTAAAALFPPTADRMAGSTIRAAQAAGRLPPPLRDTERGMRAAAQAGAVLGQTVNALPPRVSSLIQLLVRFGPAAAAAALGTAAIVGATTRGIRAFAEYERQMLTTEQVIRATGGAAGRTAQDIDRLARDIGRGTLASTSAVREAAAQVLTFRSITGETFDRTLRLAQDLSAAGFGSISQSAVQLAKALEDPEQGLLALRRVGVSFSASQREMIRNFTETGRVAEAQNLILAQVEKQVGGAGVAAGSGLSGAFDALTEETERWFQLVGRNMSDLLRLPGIFEGIADGVGRINDAMSVDREQTRLDELRFQRDDLLRLLSLDNERSSWNPLNMTDEARDETLARVNSLNDEMLSIQRRHREERAAIERQAEEAAAEAAKDRIEGVIAGLQREIDMLGQTELARSQLAAVQKAGVQLDDEAGQKIAAMVEQTFRLQKAREAASLLAELEREAELNAAILQHGEDSIQVARLRKEAERDVFEQTLESLHVSEDLKAELIRAWEAARGLAATNMAATIAAARAEASGMANEIMRAIGAMQSLQAQSGRALERARLAGDPVALAGFDARNRARDTQGVLRQGAEGGELAYLDALVEAEGRAAEAAVRTTQENQKLNQTRAAGGGAAAAQTSAVRDLIATLQLELDILAATDPVQRELLRHREALAQATDTERQMVEELIAARQRDEAAASALADRAQMYGNMAASALDQLIVQGKSADEVIKNLIRTLLQATIQAAIFGSGPLGGLFGGVGIFGGAPKMKGGGRISGPGTGTSDSVPILASDGEFMVNARATQANLPLLEAINEGRALPAFARGGRVGGGGGTVGTVTNTGAPQFNIDVRGARGNREIEEAVARGVEAGLKQYDAYVLPRSFARISGDRRKIG